MLSEQLEQKVDGLRAKALLVGVVATALALAGGLVASFTGTDAGLERALQPFVIAFMFVLGFSVSGLSVVMLHHLCGGAWSFMIQRICEAASRTLPFVFVLGLIVLVGGAAFTGLYPWTSEEYLKAHHIVELKTPFLNVGVYTLGYLVYFGIWMALMLGYNKWSKQLEATGDTRYIAKMQFWAGPGLILYVVTMTLASTHWTMSLEPEWFSTIYGAWLIAGFNITIISFAIVMITFLAQDDPIKSKITTRHIHHLGTFLCGFVIFWSYVSFCQFLLIWNANLPEEIGWYLKREGGLVWMTRFLIVFHWLIPMMLLFQRPVKRNPLTLRRIAFFLIAMRVVDLYWNIVPSFPGNHQTINFSMVVLVLLAVAGIGGLWFWLFLGELKRRPLLPENDPRATFHFLKDTQHHHTEVTGHA